MSRIIIIRIIHQKINITHSKSQSNQMQQLTKQQQYHRIVYLGISFMIMFTSYNSLQNIVSKLYDENGYKNLGQTALMFAYGTFGASVFFSSFVVKKLGFKKAMFYSSFGYGVFQSTSFLVVADLQNSKWIVWMLVISGATICGISAGSLWVAQGAYVSAVAGNFRQTELFGVFSALMKSSHFFGNLLIALILGKMSNFAYFSVLTFIGFSSSVIFLFLPDASKQGQVQKKQTTFHEEIQKVYKIASSKKYLDMNLYFWFSGFTTSFYAGFLYKLVQSTMAQQNKENDQDFQHRVNFWTGLVFLVLAVFQIATGIVMRFVENLCTFRLAVVASLIIWMAGFISLICYLTESLALCFVCSAVWGGSETFIQTVIGVLVSKIFNGKVQAFSVYRLYSSTGVVSVLLLSIILSSAPNYIFLVIILITITVIVRLSTNLKLLKKTTVVDQDSKDELGTQLINLQYDEGNCSKLKNIQ